MLDWLADLCFIFWGIRILLVVFVFCLCVCAYWTKDSHVWWSQNVPQIKQNQLKEFFGTNTTQLHISEKESYERYGRIYGRFDGRLPVLTIGETEILENILEHDFHDYFYSRRDMKFHDIIMDNTLFVLEKHNWKRVRNVVLRSFSTASQKRMICIIEKSCEYLIHNLDKENEGTGKVDFQTQFENFVLHSIGTCAFGLEMDCLEDPENEFRKYSGLLFKETCSWRTTLTTKCPELMKLFRLRLLNPEATEFFKGITKDALEERKTTNLERNDFLQMIMNAEEEDSKKIVDCNNNGLDTSSHVKANGESNKPKEEPIFKNKRRLSHDEVLAQCVTFFIAGSESTTSLLSNAVFLLTRNPEVQEKAYQEVMEKLPTEDYDEHDLYQALNEMKYLEAVLNECLRMVPAMVRLERTCHQDYLVKTKDKDIVLKKGSLVNIPVFAMHYDPDYFPDPYTFKPERFLQSSETVNQPRHLKYAFLGFGEGGRKCVAFRFVYMWTKLCLAKILKEFKLEPTPLTSTSLEISESRGLLKIEKTEVGIKKRNASKQTNDVSGEDA